MLSLERHLGIGIPRPGEDPEFDRAVRENSQAGGSTYRLLKDLGIRWGLADVSYRGRTHVLFISLAIQDYEDACRKPATRFVRIQPGLLTRFTPHDDSVYHVSRWGLISWLHWIVALSKQIHKYISWFIGRLIRATKIVLRSLCLAMLAILATLLDVLPAEPEDRVDCRPTPRVLAAGGWSGLHVPLI